MPILTNKFVNHKPSPETEILILGTFTHDHHHSGDFFFGRPRNFLWHLLPICFGSQPLKDAPLVIKQEFMQKHKIDFTDVIATLEVEDGEEEIMEEDFVDISAKTFFDLVEKVDALPKLKAVYFTRKTFNGMPNIKAEILKLAQHCQSKQVRLCKLDTPARHFSDEKQQQWIDTIVLQKTCLRP
jgi:G:T/U-mismatch repair DNA glycosylase